MPLNSGSRLGPYEILTPLGAGGMGEVYKARDTRLDRTVAIKVLPSHFSADPERRERFEREARVISSLNHPQICTLYDVGRHEDTDFLVMEYLEGESLAERLTRGTLPLEQALRCATEIADALDKAHRQGITHRDLKPGNIMLTKGGTKLLDFGLAKLRDAAAPGGLSNLPTKAASLTVEGTVLGTFQYMAPEQLEGREADARTDIFAFGAILYEMVTGKKAFSGKSQASLISAIMSSQPEPISALQPLYPAGLERLVRKCLSKDPEERWQNAHDLATELHWLAEASSHEDSSKRARQSGKRREQLAWATAAAAVLLAMAAVVWDFQSGPTETALKTTVSVLPPANTSINSLAVSPDGRKLVMAGNIPGSRQTLWLRSLDSLESKPLNGTQGGNYPFWSPDSRFVAFFAEGRLKKIDVISGAVQTLCDARNGRGGAWNRQGEIVFQPDLRGPLVRVAESGGVPSPVTKAPETDTQSAGHRWPSFLPDGRHFLYVDHHIDPPQRKVYLASLDSEEALELLEHYSQVVYAPPGYLLYVHQGVLMAQAFDVEERKIRGGPVPVTEAVGSNPGFGNSNFTVSETGILVFGPQVESKAQMVWVDASGKELGTVGPPHAYLSPRLSPDETRLAVSQIDPLVGYTDIWILDLARNLPSRFTFHSSPDYLPNWSPDGSKIAYSTVFDLRIKPATGAGEEEIVAKAKASLYASDWSRDGKYLAFHSLEEKTRWDLWVLELSSPQKPQPVLVTPYNELWGQFSPDGRWLAYVSDESGSNEVYIQPFPDPGAKVQVSTESGSSPKWHSNGTQLFYVDRNLQLMVVDIVEAQGTVRPGIPRKATEAKLGAVPLPVGSAYEVSKDGTRFLIDRAIEEVNNAPLTAILNWTSGL